jgi:tRNA(adenine34) deaminase
MNNDQTYMSRALALAGEAFLLGEVPVGAVIVRDGVIIAEARNEREGGRNALLHAETTAIGLACKAAGGWRLTRSTMYVTLEPCPMCAGAIVNARIDRVVIGARDPKGGAFGGVLDLNSFPLNHRPEIVFGLCEDECAGLMRDFFARLRRP